MFEPLQTEEKAIAIRTKSPLEEVEYRQRYIKGHINAIRTHVTKAIMAQTSYDNTNNKMTQAVSLLEKQLSKVERDAHDMLEIVKKAIK